MKKYKVNIDMTWSKDFNIRAANAAEAKKKAWDKFKKNPPKKNFTLLTDKSTQ